MEEWPGISDWSHLEVIDASGKIVFPTYCDSHTHIVFFDIMIATGIETIFYRMSPPPPLPPQRFGNTIQPLAQCDQCRTPTYT
jgi:hypothetical protein